MNKFLLILSIQLLSVFSAASEVVTVRTLAIDKSEFPKLWITVAGKPFPLEFPGFKPSTPFRADRSNPLLVHSGELDVNGLPADKSPSLVRLPSDSSILLLGWTVEDKPRFIAIPDPFLKAGQDDWLIINTTARAIGIQIGASTEPTKIQPEKSQVVKVSAPANQGAATVMASLLEGEWKSFYSTYWPIFEDKRCIVLITQQGEKMRVKVIPDLPIEAEE